MESRYNSEGRMSPHLGDSGNSGKEGGTFNED